MQDDEDFKAGSSDAEESSDDADSSNEAEMVEEEGGWLGVLCRGALSTNYQKY